VMASWHRIHFGSMGSISGLEGSLYVVDPTWIWVDPYLDPKRGSGDPAPQALVDPVTQFFFLELYCVMKMPFDDFCFE